MDPALRELLREVGTDRVVEAIIRLRRPRVQLPGVRIVARFGSVATCRLPLSAIRAVRAHPAVVSLKAARPLGPECGAGCSCGDSSRCPGPCQPCDAEKYANPASRQSDSQDSGHQMQGGRIAAPRGTRAAGFGLTGAGVLVGVVDWGLDFDHPNFKNADGSTRLTALWDQRAPHTRPDEKPYRTRPYGYGIVHTREAIDTALATGTPYHALGYHPAEADRGGGSHGTHVMDIAAGNGATGPAGVAPEADLVFVHLADRGTDGLANLGDSVRLLEAVDFIHRIAGDRPWVINLSMGRHGGPHDGSTLTELALDELLSAAPGRFIAQSAGNYHESHTHANGQLRQGDSTELRFVTDPADTTSNELEIWYPGSDELVIRLEPPGAIEVGSVRLGEAVDVIVAGQVVGRVYHRAHDPNNGDHHVDAFLYPWAPAGQWGVRLEGRCIADGRWHAWLERDEACPRCQARFVPRDASADTTIGTIASGHMPLVVGAYDDRSPFGRPAGRAAPAPLVTTATNLTWPRRASAYSRLGPPHAAATAAPVCWSTRRARAWRHRTSRGRSPCASKPVGIGLTPRQSVGSRSRQHSRRHPPPRQGTG